MPQQSATHAPLAPDLKAGTLLVSELYASIQGESTYMGRPCTFVRLTGCPLRCRWCDSAFAFQGGERLSTDAVLDQVRALGLPLVEVTGGEPLAQKQTPALLRALCDAGYEVLLETSGSIDVSPVDTRVVKIMDIKCPASGETARNHWDNLKLLQPRDEIKFVIASREDYEWARRVVSEYGLGDRVTHFSPAWGDLQPADLAQWIVDDRLPVRFQLQLHKQLWPGRERGV